MCLASIAMRENSAQFLTALASDGNPADRAPDFLGITSQGFVQSSRAQSIQVLKGNQGLRINPVTKAQPRKITEGLLRRRDPLILSFGINTRRDTDESQFA